MDIDFVINCFSTAIISCDIQVFYTKRDFISTSNGLTKTSVSFEFYAGGVKLKSFCTAEPVKVVADIYTESVCCRYKFLYMYDNDNNFTINLFDIREENGIGAGKVNINGKYYPHRREMYTRYNFGCLNFYL